ncbi:tripartite tricarboxylate transporter substrate binding protein [Roseomonas sp. PWR1]|uniref:Tripartite tricarboxylate transporter substrate binding protein n=1 Tax=Roseomonas nitratireducens TaxID=2820810 RepID=A0ABS4ARJ3_9PROT|nr:tripartite tricarboxylate transporter substrate binding protein [Neoroseomonas nitratireducens]MBP0463973.1 tripartite tricarboxylate transporter substrate binding protein [Neoroseomonas nitratireducens]
MRRRTIIGAAAGLALARPAIAQGSWPDRPIRWIVPFPPGGSTDLWARLVSEPMAAELGQPIVIDNRGGAGGLIGTEAAAKATPDGHTMLFTITTHVQSPVVLRRFPYDPVADFAPIGKLGVTPLVLCASPATQGGTVQDFVAWARGRDLSYGSYAPGSSGHAYGQMFSDEARLGMTHVAYRGEGPMLQDMVAGTVACAFHSMAASGGAIRAGRIRPLGLSGTRQLPSLPSVPLLRASGFSTRFEFSGFIGLLAPVRTPQPILDRAVAAFRKVVEAEAVQRRLVEIDTIPAYLGPDAFREDIARCLREWTALATELNLSVQG